MAHNERSRLIKEADRVFSLYVRNRGANVGYNFCYTCLRTLSVDELQAGHFMARRFMNTRWHPLNVWSQCNDCNVGKHGNLKIYEQRLRTNYGDEAIEGLKDLAYSVDKTSLTDIKDIIKKYR